MSTQVKSEAETVVRQLIAALNDADRAGAEASLAANCRMHCNGHLEASNVAEYWEVFSSFHRAMPDLHQEVVELVVTDSVVAERWTNCGTHLGEFNGLPPSGRTVEFTGTTFFHVADGLIVEEFNTVDLYGLLQQIEAA